MSTSGRRAAEHALGIAEPGRGLGLVRLQHAVHRVDVQRQPVPDRQMLGRAAQEAGMHMRIDQPGHEQPVARGGRPSLPGCACGQFRRRADRRDTIAAKRGSAPSGMIRLSASMVSRKSAAIDRASASSAIFLARPGLCMKSLQTSAVPARNPPRARRSSSRARGCCRSGSVGITEASAMRRPSMPRTCSSGSTTAAASVAHLGGAAGVEEGRAGIADEFRPSRVRLRRREGAA